MNDRPLPLVDAGATLKIQRSPFGSGVFVFVGECFRDAMRYGRILVWDWPRHPANDAKPFGR